MPQVDPNTPLSDAYLKAHATDPDVAPYLSSEERRRLSRLRVTPPPAGNPTMHAPTGKEPVTLGDLLADPAAALKRGFGLLASDLTDPKLLATAAASFLVPKAVGMVAPLAEGAMAGAREVATPGMAKDLGILTIGDARINAASRIGGRLKNAASAMRGPSDAPVSPEGPASTPATPPPNVPTAGTAAPPVSTRPPVRATPPVARTTTPVDPAMEEIANRMAGGPDRPTPGNGSPAFDLNSLTPQEKIQALKWYEGGMTPEKILENIGISRKLTGSFNTPTPDEAATAVADRNNKGRWPE